jgi:16S rRNA (uracil1498-N3)-methyltransferase
LGENKIQLTSLYQKGNDAIVLIGPEGDFSNTELKSGVDAGFTEVILGTSRLRTETAALVAVVQLNSLNQ